MYRLLLFMFRDEIKEAISQSIKKVFPEVEMPDFSISAPEHPEQGDYASNAALILGKQVKTPPMKVAELLMQQIKNGKWRMEHRTLDAGSLTSQGRETSAMEDGKWRMEIKPPGFLNFFIKDNALIEHLNRLLENSDSWGKNNAKKNKTIIVEYFQLNIAKRPHVGHLRSAVIGDAVKRMLLSQGYNAVSDTHVGDWGTQFGILLKAYKEYGDKKILAAADPFAELEKLYSAENERIEKDPELREQAKEEFARLERGDSQNRAIWEEMLAVSMKKLNESAERLGLLPFDEHRGESAYEKDMLPIVESALIKEIAKKQYDGSVVVDLAAEGLDEAVLTKSDGASTYLLRDLATIRYRKERWNFHKNLYFVDVRQSHHFKQLFRVAELLGFEGVGESAHVVYGFMTLPEGAMSTRKGNAISLDAVIDEAVRRARAAIGEKNPELKNPDTIAQQIGLGALKYFDLSRHRTSDIAFRWDEALAFEGNTGPYLQYTHARLKSILRKVGESPSVSFPPGISPDPLERRTLVSVFRFPDAVEDALADFTPNTFANYLHDLAQIANEFYHSHPVLKETDNEKRAFRIALILAIALTLKKGLHLLGIEAPEEM